MTRAATEQQVPSMRLEVVKSTLRRYASPAVVESVVKRAIVTNHVDPSYLSHAELEAVVAGAISGLRRVIDAKMMFALLIELNETVASAQDELESAPGSVCGYSGTVRIARRR